jgi:membrane protein involved in colicin uptake
MKQISKSLIAASLAHVFVTNNSGAAYGFEGLRILCARERETDEPQKFELDADQAFRLKDYLNEQDPFIEVIIQPFQGSADAPDSESTGPSAEELAAQEKAAADDKAAEEKAAADKAAAAAKKAAANKA